MRCMMQPGSWSSWGCIASPFIIARSSIFSAPYLRGPARIASRRASGYCVTNRTANNRIARPCKRGTAQALNQIQVRHCCCKLSMDHHSPAVPRCLAPQGGSTSSWAVLPASSRKLDNLGFKAAGVLGAQSQPQATPHKMTPLLPRLGTSWGAWSPALPLGPANSWLRVFRPMLKHS